MRAVLDTSILIAEDAPVGIEGAISVVSITELVFGVLITDDPDERARRVERMASVQAVFDPLPVTDEVARAWGRLAAAVARRGGKPRRRQLDLAIAATSLTERVPLLTYNVADFAIIQDLVEVRHPNSLPPPEAEPPYSGAHEAPSQPVPGRSELGSRRPDAPSGGRGRTSSPPPGASSPSG